MNTYKYNNKKIWLLDFRKNIRKLTNNENFELIYHYFDKILEALGSLDENNFLIFQKKLTDACNNLKKWDESYHRAIIDIFVELLGFYYFRKEGFNTHFLLEKEGIRTSDIVAKNEKNEIYIECKNIHMSDRQNKELEENRKEIIGVGILSENYNDKYFIENNEKNPLYKKLKSTIENAENQLIIHDKKVIFINICFDFKHSKNETNILKFKENILLPMKMNCKTKNISLICIREYNIENILT